MEALIKYEWDTIQNHGIKKHNQKKKTKTTKYTLCPLEPDTFSLAVLSRREKKMIHEAIL